ncbi:MAG: hypothetical protein JO161_01695, partial [Planctomycetaceae bacterium]|nr:hypothetical protein [Planctomycetaceae bacterium]
MKNLSGLHSRRDTLGLGAMSGLGLALAGGGLGVDRVQAQPVQSKSPRSADPLRSAGALAFGPDNVLFVGDIAGSAVHAFALRDKDLTPQTGVILGNFQNFEGVDLVLGLDVKLAALMGTTYDNIVINDMVVHEPTKQIILSVERGRGADVIPAIVKVNRGQLEVLNLDSIPHSSTLIPNEPDANARLEFEPQRVYAITDVKYYKGEVFVTGISNQRFASTLYRIPYPFTGDKSTSTVEIWHPVHGEFETR